MAVAKAEALSAEQQRALIPTADAALAEEAADAAHRKSIEDAQEAAEQQRRANAAKCAKAKEAWLEAVGQMQEAAKQFVSALERGLEAAADERAAGPGASSVLAGSDPARMSRISRYLSGEFRRIFGPTAPRFGEMSLTAVHPRPLADWTAEERRFTGGPRIMEEDNA